MRCVVSLLDASDTSYQCVFITWYFYYPVACADGIFVFGIVIQFHFVYLKQKRKQACVPLVVLLFSSLGNDMIVFCVFSIVFQINMIYIALNAKTNSKKSS